MSQPAAPEFRLLVADRVIDGSGGAPVEPGWSSGRFVVGVPKGEEARLPEVRAMVDRLNAEDLPVLKTIRFRRGLLTASDRQLARYFKYVEEFPCFLPPG